VKGSCGSYVRSTCCEFWVRFWARTFVIPLCTPIPLGTTSPIFDVLNPPSILFARSPVRSTTIVLSLKIYRRCLQIQCSHTATIKYNSILSRVLRGAEPERNAWFMLFPSERAVLWYYNNAYWSRIKIFHPSNDTVKGFLSSRKSVIAAWS